MNGYELSRTFFDWAFSNPEKVKPNHVALYFFAIEHCNRLGWKKKFGLPTTMSKEALGIKSYKTYINTFNDLADWGFITIIERSKNQYSSNIIALSNFTEAHTKALDKALIKHGRKHGRKQVQSTGESIGSIDKQVTSKQLTINKEQSASLFYPFDSKLFFDQWNRWIKYKKDEHRFTYKTIDSQQTALNTLLKDSGENEGTAIEIINQSIGNGYKGLFKLKNSNNEQPTRRDRFKKAYDDVDKLQFPDN